MTMQIKPSFDSANDLIIFILQTIERSPWDHMFNVFLKYREISTFLFRHF